MISQQEKKNQPLPPVTGWIHKIYVHNSDSHSRYVLWKGLFNCDHSFLRSSEHHYALGRFGRHVHAFTSHTVTVHPGCKICQWQSRSSTQTETLLDDQIQCLINILISTNIASMFVPKELAVRWPFIRCFFHLEREKQFLYLERVGWSSHHENLKLFFHQERLRTFLHLKTSNYDHWITWARRGWCAWLFS